MYLVLRLTFISFAKVGHLLFVCLAFVQKLISNLQFKFIMSAQLLQNCCCAFVFISE
jgi:hypothetical protein